MIRAMIVAAALGAGFLFFNLDNRRTSPQQGVEASEAASDAGIVSVGVDAPMAANASTMSAAPNTANTATAATTEPHEGLIYGRVTTDDGDTYEGRLRWGGDEEALWSNQFNGFRKENRWVSQMSGVQLPKERVKFEVFGLTIAGWDREVDFGRPFLARFGDIARIDARGRDLSVTLKSGSTFELDRYASDDLADDLRVWDETRGVHEINEWDIRSIEFLSTARLAEVPSPLTGTVRTAQGDFTGLIQWDREENLDSDELDGYVDDREVSLRFADIAAIERRANDGSLVTMLDGSQVLLSGTRNVGQGNRGVYVDDPRYGRVLVSWEAFDRLELGQGGIGFAYDHFAPGRVLSGRVTNSSGERLAGRLVFDLDESETTETLDAPSGGIDYMIPFGMVASIVLPGVEESGSERATVTLLSGEQLKLEREGDLSERNAGLLVFTDEGADPEYVPWGEVARVDFDGGLSR